jgi:hypothetical protein
MKRIFNILILAVIVGLIPTTMSCEKPPTVVLDPDLTGQIIGAYEGNYVVNYEANPQDNFSSQINLVVSRIDKKLIRIDAQGGDSFECTLSGIEKSLTLSNMTNKKGVYASADNLEGSFINNRLYYKVTGTLNGGPFSAEFTAIL